MYQSKTKTYFMVFKYEKQKSEARRLTTESGGEMKGRGEGRFG